MSSNIFRNLIITAILNRSSKKSLPSTFLRISQKLSTTLCYQRPKTISTGPPFCFRENNIGFVDQEHISFEKTAHKKLKHKAALLTDIYFILFLDELTENARQAFFDVFCCFKYILNIGVIAQNVDKQTVSKACLADEARRWFLFCQ